MKALILAAGLGTRLKPFTLSHPKALYVTEGKTLLEHAIAHIKSAGVTDVIINVHHFAEQIIAFLSMHDNFGLKITISDEQGQLLETGGGLKKAGWFLNDCDCAIVRNVDIISDLDLAAMAKVHLAGQQLATLAVRNRATSRYFLFDGQMKLCGWENIKTGEKRLSRNGCECSAFAFSGLQIINPAIFPLIVEEGNFSLTALYLRLAQSNDILGYIETGQTWRDVGSLP